MHINKRGLTGRFKEKQQNILYTNEISYINRSILTLDGSKVRQVHDVARER